MNPWAGIYFILAPKQSEATAIDFPELMKLYSCKPINDNLCCSALDLQCWWPILLHSTRRDHVILSTFSACVNSSLSNCKQGTKNTLTWTCDRIFEKEKKGLFVALPRTNQPHKKLLPYHGYVYVYSSMFSAIRWFTNEICDVTIEAFKLKTHCTQKIAYSQSNLLSFVLCRVCLLHRISMCCAI